MAKRIEICGGIAAGKTTLTEILEKNGYTPVYERFEDNPFLNQFYKNSTFDNTFETEIACTLMHYSQIKQNQGEAILVSDYAMIQDYSYGMQNLTPVQKEVYDSMYRYLSGTLAPVDMIIYLKCGAECLLERIQKRNRDMETSITKEYLQEHIAALEYNLRYEAKDSLLVIDSEKYDYRGKDKSDILSRIENCMK